ncbi:MULTISPECIES: Panacea domain-containing protein [Clavibacter]|uniref:DUF4065 domain-containing protein n=2 Tax=Clavibacter TaxID=1573 RepID=A0A399NZE5_9MICO|nr:MULTISPECIES: type II toxin-antitoxin system antitoxin SocA domain-containing protein [Clavibacter]KDP89696.1 XRE family transcriptional regulator [Clavibacter cf. michiganensis LMG 26808]RII97956.1 DUF4065 domain-containing protein [Clavibacter michiganensis]UKF25928.1 DUF4065 domain-containing protein [Clavibacter sp. A6099]
MTNIHDVAAYITQRFTGPISTMKLQKLTYFSQGWTLALLGRPLFEEQFSAWTRGPVAYALYNEHRGLYSVSDWRRGDANAVSDEERVVIDAVLSNYGALSGAELSDLTHRRDTPWAEARARVGAIEGAPANETIDREAMTRYFRRSFDHRPELA